MRNATSVLDLAFPPRSAREAAYRWLYGSLRNAILERRLVPGGRLPATRDLARQYSLARGTVVSAFEQLKSEGYIEGSVGSGTYVSRVLPEQWLQVSPDRDTRVESRRVRRAALSVYGQRVRAFSGYEDRPIRAFRANLPALDLFPIELWAKITNRSLRRAPVRQLMGCDALGYLPLRKAVAEYLTASRGVKCEAGQVAIVSGVQEALDLTARLLLNPGDRVCMESPGYIGALLVFRACGAKILAVAVDDEGARTQCLPARGVRMIYVTPGHQFPLGTTMSLARRMELLEWAHRSGAVIFEDDYDSEFRYCGPADSRDAGTGSRGPRAVRGQLQQGVVPGSAPGVRGVA